MIPLSTIQASNSSIGSSIFPSNPVAVFTGATSGIGEATLKEFVKNCDQKAKPRCYLIGRNAEAASQTITECQALNPSAEVIFLKYDLSLIFEVDKLCEELKQRENTVNLLFISHGSVSIDKSRKFIISYSSPGLMNF
jgi:NADP-dependent 3-hydroxy acid dehydrogenase YdfG